MVSTVNIAAGSAGRPYAGRHALVVEGDADTRAICTERLERLGFEVKSVDNGVGAVRAARFEAPDLILLDLQLRDVPGLELIDWLRSNPDLAFVPIIAIRTFGFRDDDPRVADGGVRVVIRKPLSAAHVDDAIAQSLTRA